jgi:hypothetical protein
MNKIKTFGGFLNEKFKFSGSCSSDLCQTMIPILTSVGDLVGEYQQGQADLLKIQQELHRASKVITDKIRSETTHKEELDWDAEPKAPVFVLTLKQRYPQNEEAYHSLWYKAANRLDKFNYGCAIAIFKTYCKRENLLLEEHDYGHDEKIDEETK